MDQHRFDALTRCASGASSRRDVLRLLGVAATGGGGSALLGTEGAAARRRKKRKPKRGTPRQDAPTCGDVRKNGSETDVDCGGTCPRCGLGKICASRDDCTTALCAGGVCAEWTNPADCGQDTNGLNCATRTNAAGHKICTKIDGRFFAPGTCAERCLAAEQCVLPTSGGVECVLPCGAPDA